MTIWLVMDGDYDDSWVVAGYVSEALAQEHAERVGLHRVESVEVLHVLSPTAIDTREARALAAAAVLEQRARDAVKAEQQRAWTESRTFSDAIARGGRQQLCHCELFTKSQGYWITAHGLCQYCGGWTPAVFREHLGEAALAEAIDALDLHDRTKMRELTGLQPVA